MDTTTLAGQKAGMEYDGNHNLISYKKPGATGKYKMDYGKNKKQHLLKKATTPEGLVQSFGHDKYGNTTTSQAGKDKNTGFVRTKTEYEKESVFTYTEDGAQKTMTLEGGNFAVKQTDARGKVNTMELHPATGLKRWVRDANGTEVHYGYDKQNRMTGTECSPDGSTYRNGYSYDDSSRLKTVTHNTSVNQAEDVTYTFGYDGLGAQTEVKVGDQWLSRNVYAEDRTHKLLSSEFANGGKIVNTYDDFDRITGVSYDEETEPRYAYAYGANGKAAYLTDTNLNRKHWTEYDLAMRPKRMTTLDNDRGEILYRATLKYNKLNQLVSFGERTKGRETYLTSYEYDKDDRVTEVAFDDDSRKDKTIAHGVRYAYNGAGIVKTKTVYNNNQKRTITYTQVAGKDSGSLSPLTKAISQSGLELAYEYDDVGNIVKETRNGANIRYGYDELGQLVRSDDPTDKTAGANGTTWIYTYDLGGNIQKKVYHKYSTAAVINPATNPGVETIYEYGNMDWKDQLTAYGGKEIEYDAIGNPLRYDGWAYEWKAGRKLMGMRAEGEYVYPGSVIIVRAEIIPGTEMEGEYGWIIGTARVELEDGRVGTLKVRIFPKDQEEGGMIPRAALMIPLEDGRGSCPLFDDIYIEP